MKYLSLLSLLALFSGTAYAADASNNEYGFYFKPYVGADYDYYNVDYSNGNNGFFSKSLNGGDVHIGARVHEYLGFEASYFDTGHSSNTFIFSGTPINTTAKLSGFTGDIMGYLPVPAIPKFELIGSAGVANTKAEGKASAVNSISLSATETKARVGLGAQYWITNNLNARAMVHYQDADFDSTINHIIIASIGLNWQF